MRKKTKFITNQRLDGQDFKNIVNFTEQEFELLNQHVLVNNSATIVKGFEVTVSSGITLQLTQEDLLCFAPNGKMGFYPVTNAQLVIAMADNSTNYIEAQVFTSDTETQEKAFWDPNAGVDGQEFTQNVPTVVSQSIRLLVNQVGFSGDNDKIPVAVVVTNSGVTERIHDNYKNTVYSGSPTNPSFVENLFFALNDTNNNGISNDYNFGSPRTDTKIKTLKESNDAILTQIKNILGDGNTTANGSENNWFDPVPSNLFALNQNSSIRLVGGGNISFVASTDTLTFSADFEISMLSITGKNIIESTESPLTITNDQAAYVSLNRDAGSTSNLTVSVDDIDSIVHDKDVFILARRINDTIIMHDGTVVDDGKVVQLSVNISTPSSVSDNAIAVWDGTTGKVLQNSTVTIDSGDLVAAGNITASGYVQGQFKAKQDFLYSGADTVRHRYYNFPSDVSQIVVEATAGGGGGGGTETTSGSEFVESGGGGGGAYFMKRLNRSDCTYDSHDFAAGDVDTGNNWIQIFQHGYIMGLPVRFTTTGTLPAGLSAGVTYYLLIDNAARMTVCETQTGGTANVPSNIVTITDGGTGTHTIIPQEVFVSFGVGAGGAGGLGDTTTPSDGTPGSPTTLFLSGAASLALIRANQGDGGTRDFATTNASFAGGGAGGTVTDGNSLADVKVNGEHGGPGFMPVGGIRARSGTGGRSFYGATARTYDSATTVHGNFPGGGGCGVSAGNSTSGDPGGDGANGLVTIWEFY